MKTFYQHHLKLSGIKNLGRLLFTIAAIGSVFFISACEEFTDPSPVVNSKTKLYFRDSTYNITSHSCPSAGSPNAELKYNSKLNLTLKNIITKAGTQNIYYGNSSYFNSCSSCQGIALTIFENGKDVSYIAIGGSVTRSSSSMNLNLQMLELGKAALDSNNTPKFTLTGTVDCGL
ncbi:MAG: hypothetical protein V4543_14265 [Bacteroidota bacterium]